MPRKICCLFLAVSVFISTVVIADADDKAANHLTNGDYQQVVSVLRENGIDSAFISAGQLNQSIFDDNLLSNTEGLSILQLRELALANNKADLRAQQAAREQLADNLALLEQYKGVRFTSDARVYSDAGKTASSETISSGKVAQFRGVDASGQWYCISFDDYTGYVSTSTCTPVPYNDYKDTDAVLSEKEIARREAKAASVSTAARGSAVISGDRSLRSSIVDYAYSFIGIPYSYGGSSRSGTDCSGLTMQIFAHFGVSLIHGASDQYGQCNPVSRSALQPGDLVFFHCGCYGIGHVGLYVGGGSFLHASNYGVQVDSLYSSYWNSNFCCAGRIVAD